MKNNPCPRIWLALLALGAPGCMGPGPYRALEDRPREKVMAHVANVREPLGEYAPQFTPVESPKAHELDKKRENECLEKYDGKNPFWLGHVELTDYGTYHDHRELDVIERAVEADLKQGGSMFKQGMTIVVFVHGWFNNAEEQNGNLRHFRDLLADISENAKKEKRGVLGVYVSWRGGTVLVPPVQFLTYWSRKRAAESIGRGSMVELLARIKNLEWLVARGGKPAADPNPGLFENCRLVMIGHSFGGTALFSATAPGMKARFHEPYWDARRFGRESEEARRPMPVVTGYGDLVMLINPAMEARPYRDLHYAMHTNTTVRYDARQPVLMMTLSARNDWPNHLALPVGQLLGNRGRDLLERRHRTAANQSLASLGHYRDFHTHHLDLRSNRLELTRDVDFFKNVRHDEDQEPINKPIIPLTIKMDFKGKIDTKGDASFLPFMVVSVDPVIINGHNGFWPANGNAHAYEFVRAFVAAQNKAVAGVKQVEMQATGYRHKIR